MIEDATQKWLKDFEEPNPDFPIADKLILAMKWANLYGDSIVVLQDALNADGNANDASVLATASSGTSAGIDVFHPLVDGDGYDDPNPADLDALGYPLRFRVHVKGKKEIITIDASRCVVFKGKTTRRSWRGKPIFIGSLDDIIEYRQWRATYGKRAAQVANPGYHANKSDPNAKWSTIEQASIDAAFGKNNVALTTGTVTFGIINPPLQVGEIDSTALALLTAIADDLGVDVNDLFRTGGNAEKFAPDSNQTTYIQALLSVQKHFTQPITKVLKSFGVKFTAWNSPWEEPISAKFANIKLLSDIENNSSNPETQAIAHAYLVSRYGEEVEYTKYQADFQRANDQQRALDQASVDALRGARSGSPSGGIAGPGKGGPPIAGKAIAGKANT